MKSIRLAILPILLFAMPAIGQWTLVSPMVPFMITESSDAKITIMDATGKVVHSETESFDDAGKHFFYFNGKDVPSGTYYYTIESPLGRTIVSRKLLIVK